MAFPKARAKVGSEVVNDGWKDADVSGADPAKPDHVPFPRFYARTVRFTLGEPRSFSVAPDGGRVVFLRSRSGTDRAQGLWLFDVATGEERCVADPTVLLRDGERLSVEERARRERSREHGVGVVSYATDHDMRIATFALSGQVFVADLTTGTTTALPAAAPAIDPRPDPSGQWVAYVADRALRLSAVDGSQERVLAEPESEAQAWGLAEFVAAEEMSRSRGFWWAPDGLSLLVEHYDEAAVQQWYLADPANPNHAPLAHRFPAAGTANADVTLWQISLDGIRRQVHWDRTTLPYLTSVSWPAHAAGAEPLIQVQSRDQRRAITLAVHVSTADRTVPTSVVAAQEDAHWVDIVPGLPTWLPGGQVLTAVDDADTRRLAIDHKPVTPVALHIRSVLDVDDFGVLFTASTDETETHVYRLVPQGVAVPISREPGVHTARSAGGTTVLVSRRLDRHGQAVEVLRDGASTRLIPSRAVRPPFLPVVRLHRAAPREHAYALLFPRDHVPGSRRLPVLMDPYGGPGAQRVLTSSAAFLEPQWWADQGFAVVIADGRGGPGRSPSWERAIAGDLAIRPLEDQVSALREAAATSDDLDLSRVAIRGWSFGGYLAALAVLRRPDVFHAAIAGAPVTDWRLYDTHYTERYLGDPNKHGATYDANALLQDAASLARPLLLIHGLADDNVVVAHSLRLSQALLEAGKSLQFLPLSGVTHMATQEVVAENLLLLQLEFVRTALGVN
jgi:dipeptidyl-peptidase 4